MFRDLLIKASKDILTIRLIEIPRLVFYAGVIIFISYCATMIFVGLPVAIWEHFTKKKVNSDIENKVIITITIILAIVFALAVLYQKYI